MDSVDAAINNAIRDETLSDDACAMVFQKRRNQLAADTELLPADREGGLRDLDNVIANEVPQAITDGTPIVKILKRELRAIGELYHENHYRLLAERETSSAGESSAAPQSGEEVKEEPDGMGGVEQDHNEDKAPVSENSKAPEHEDEVMDESEISEQVNDEDDTEEEAFDFGDAQKEGERPQTPEEVLQDLLGEVFDTEESDEVEEEEVPDSEDDSDYEGFGKKAAGKGKVKSKTKPAPKTKPGPKVGRPLKKDTDAYRVTAAMEVRKKRKFRTHHPRTNDPKVLDRTPRLYDVPDEMPEAGDAGSASSASSLAADDKAEDAVEVTSPIPFAPPEASKRKTAKPKPVSPSSDKDDEPAPPPALTPAAAARAERADRRTAGMTHAEPIEQPAITLSKKEKRDPSPSSLIVKLHIGKSAAASPPKPKPTVPAKRVPAKRGRARVLSKNGRVVKSKEVVSSDMEEEDEDGVQLLIARRQGSGKTETKSAEIDESEEEDDAQFLIAPTKGSGKTKTKTTEPDPEIDDSENDAQFLIAPKKHSGKTKTFAPDPEIEIESSEEDIESDTEILRKSYRRGVTANIPARRAITSTRRNIPIPSARRAFHNMAMGMSATTPDFKTSRSAISTLSSALSSLASTPQKPSSPHVPSPLPARQGRGLAPTPHAPSGKAQKYPSFPPLLRTDITHFHRGTIIALENVLEEHLLDPESSLLEIIECLDDTRPIVNDREHKMVMAGGRWVYAILRDVAQKREEQGNEGEEEEEDEELNVQGLYGEMVEWVGRQLSQRR